MNVLLTCVGRRNYLVRYFQDAFRLLGIPGKVVATDLSPYAPAMREADVSVAVPPVASENYLQALLEVCKSQEVGLIISLNDLELPVLAEASGMLEREGVRAIVSSPEVIGTCFDKWETYRFLVQHNIPSPKTFLTLEEATSALAAGDASFPLIVKPRWGSASIGIQIVGDEEELRLMYALQSRRIHQTILATASASDPERCILVQEVMSSQEYGLDVINNLNKEHQGVVVKKKLSMRAGETDRAVTVRIPQLEALGRQLGRALGHVGNLDCDVFWDGDRAAVLELNPRFGGGYPFSHAAGINLPAAILAWATGHPVDPQWFIAQAGITAAKYDHLMVFESRES